MQTGNRVANKEKKMDSPFTLQQKILQELREIKAVIVLINQNLTEFRVENEKEKFEIQKALMPCRQNQVE